jgi:hypothetical protein
MGVSTEGVDADSPGVCGACGTGCKRAGPELVLPAGVKFCDWRAGLENASSAFDGVLSLALRPCIVSTCSLLIVFHLRLTQSQRPSGLVFTDPSDSPMMQVHAEYLSAPRTELRLDAHAHAQSTVDLHVDGASNTDCHVMPLRVACVRHVKLVTQYSKGQSYTLCAAYLCGSVL